MKKYITVLFGTLFYTTLLLAQATADTNTSVSFTSPEVKRTNEYGDKIMEQNVTITTKNFKINNYWGNYSDAAPNQSNFTNITTNANVQLTIENSFTCKDGGLAEEGCSGQKPFLINQGTLDNNELKKDANGVRFLNQNEYRIPFDSASNYDPSHDDAFYALDVFRDGKYYEDDNTSDYNEAKPKTFFGYMLSLIKTYFSPQNDTTVITALTASQVKARNRYMANIIFGLQQDYRIKKDSVINTNSINQAFVTKQPSLLDYNSLMIKDTTGCDGIFFTFNPNSFTCKLQNFFGMSQWMPFFGNNTSLFGEYSNKNTIQSDSVLEDTETTLLTLASKLDNTNYIQPKIDPNNNTTFLGEVFKPMTYMMGSMFRFFFGESSKNLTEVVSVDFNFTNRMPLTFVQVENGIVKGFEYFQLLGIESVYGTEVQQCKVGLRSSVDVLGFFASEETFREGEVNQVQLKVAGNYKTFPTDDWLDWCKRHQDENTKGIFGRFLDLIGTIFGNNVHPTSYNELDDLLSNKSWGKVTFSDHKYKKPFIISKKWKVKEYKEKVHKGLILHLKKIDIRDINATTPGTTTHFKIMNIQRGNH